MVMKKCFFLTILVLLLSFNSFTQETLICPKVTVKPKVEMIPAGNSVNLTVLLIDGKELKSLEFRWLVSKGTISEGQGTNSITVTTTNEMQGMTITATVEIKGLPIGCETVFAGFGEIAAAVPTVVCRCTLDDYGRIPWTDEMQRLDSLRVELVNDPKAKGVLIFSAVGNSDLKSVKNRQKKIIRLFQKYYRIPQSRLIMQVENRGDYNTKLYVIPEGAELPF